MVANVAAAATLAAFDRAERTGVGTLVDFSSFAAAAKMTETAVAGAAYLGDDASRLGVKTVLPWAVYECADGMMQVLCVEQPQWEALVELMGNPEWAQLDVFATLEGRQDNTDLLDIYLERVARDPEGRRAVSGCSGCPGPVHTGQLDGPNRAPPAVQGSRVLRHNP